MVYLFPSDTVYGIVREMLLEGRESDPETLAVAIVDRIKPIIEQKLLEKWAP
jgi:hypothetical protein